MRWVLAFAIPACAVACSHGGNSGGGGNVGQTANASSASTTNASSVGSSSTTTSSSSGTGGALPTCTGKSGPAGEQDLTIMSSGVARSYRIHVPQSYDPTKGAELVLAFHGYGDAVGDFEGLTNFVPVSDAKGFLLVYPVGVAPLGVPGWNAGTCCGSAQIANTPDVQFVHDLIDKLEADYCVDPKRVFATGFSNGGMLSHRLACELSDRIAAIGAVSGTMAVSTCNPTRPVPVLHIHGTADPVIAYGGGPFAQSVADTIAGWVMRNGCNPVATQIYLMGSAHCEIHTGCIQGADVELCTIEGGVHEWPGGGTAMGMGDLDASSRILAFFDAHPMP